MQAKHVNYLGRTAIAVITVVLLAAVWFSLPVPAEAAHRDLALTTGSYNAMAFMPLPQEITRRLGSSYSQLFAVDANTLAQANGATGQTLYVYRTVDTVASPTNYERLVMQWNVGQTNFRIGPEAGGTGTLRALDINSGGSLGILSSAGGRVFIIGNTGLITQYGNAATVAQGVAPIRGTQSLTAQNAAIGATNVLAAAAAGLYRVCFNAATTTSGTGTTATVSVIWTDAGGVKTFTSATWALNAVDVTGQVGGCQVIRSAAAANIQVSTAGTFGTSVYRLDATAEAVQ